MANIANPAKRCNSAAIRKGPESRPRAPLPVSIRRLSREFALPIATAFEVATAAGLYLGEDGR